MENRHVYVIDGKTARMPDAPGSNAADKKRRKKNRGNARARQAGLTGAHGGWPRAAASCSMLVAGTGHFLHRRWKSGAFYLTIFATALATPFLLRLGWARLLALLTVRGMGEIDLLVGLFLVEVFAVAALLTGVFTAYTIGMACSGDLAAPRARPTFAGLASLVVPGWGQIVNGQIAKALAFLFVVYAGVLGAVAWLALPDAIAGAVVRATAALPPAIRPVAPVTALAVIASVTWALSLYDAVLIARHRRRAGAPGGVLRRSRYGQRTAGAPAHAVR